MSRSRITNDRGSDEDAPPRPIEDLTAGLAQALELGTSIERVDVLLGDSLEAFGQLVPFDLAAILELVGDELRVRVARGPLDSERVRRHKLKLADFPSVKAALAQGHAVAFEEHDHADGDGDPYDGVLDLPHGHHCMVVPLQGPGGALGVVTFDRTRCGMYSSDLVQLAEVFGRLLAVAMSFGEQTAALTRLRSQLLENNRLLREQVHGATGAGAHLEACPSEAMRRVVAIARRVAAAATPVLIRGETGTGKELLARALHEWSPRSGRPLVSLNCAVLPAGVVESELFGHVKGAFTGATADRLGRFQAANGGTLFLDEIGELPLDLQPKLLRALQEGCFEPVGSDRTVKVDVRVVAATNADLASAVKQKRFREDLYWRLAVFPIDVPPLRERRADIVALADLHLAELARSAGRAPWRLSPEAHRALELAPWPGNVRELRNVLERATILARGDEIGVDLLLLGAPPPPPAGREEGDRSLEEMERRHIEQTLERTGGRVYGTGGAAERLGLPPSTLRSRMSKLGIAGAREFRKRGGAA